MKLIKPIAKFTLVTQLLFPLLFSATSVASAVNTKQEKINHREVLAKIQSNLPELTSKQTEDAHSMTGDELLAQGLNKSAQIINADNRLDAVENLAQSTAYGFVSNQMTNWLNQYGNATIQISSDKAFSGEYFLPFYETEDNLFFSQSRIQRQNEDRTTLNLGLGYRYFMTNKMLGINSFYDHDLKNHNARWGLGAEFGADYIKLAANGYFRLTDWRNSRLSAFHDYDERPANGFDIKAEGFLPSYPQLGANIKYEKYFGDKVNLKGYNSISDLKKDPQAYTVGISYTPVPLLSFSLNQSMGDVNETKGELAVNYRIGVPLSQQLDTDLVPQMRTLMGARYNPVDRNNTIVMQYKKKSVPVDFTKSTIKVASIDKPEQVDDLSVEIGDEVTIMVTLKDRFDNLITGKTVTINRIKNESTAESKINGIVEIEKGVYTMTTTSFQSGTDIFEFTVDGKTSPSKVKVHYDEGAFVSAKATIEANPNKTTVGEPVKIIVRLVDENDKPVSINVGKIKIERTDDSTSLSPITDIIPTGKGEYTMTTTSENGGRDTFKFTVDKDEGKNTAAVTYTLKSASIVESEITATRHRLPPGYPTKLTVMLKDDNGNELSVSKEVTIFENGVEKYKDYTDKDGKFTIEVPHDGEFKGHYTFSVEGNTMNGYEDVEWYYFKGVLMFYKIGTVINYGEFRDIDMKEPFRNYDDDIDRRYYITISTNQTPSYPYNFGFGERKNGPVSDQKQDGRKVKRWEKTWFNGIVLDTKPDCKSEYYCRFDFSHYFL